MKRFSILRVVTKMLLPYILLFALYVQFHGDYGPGGGFQAGVIFGSGLILYGLVFGLGALRRVVNPRFLEVLIALGVLLYAGVGVAALVAGGNYLDYNAFDPHHPAQGQHLGLFLIELGVGLTVSAVTVTIFFNFAGKTDEPMTLGHYDYWVVIFLMMTGFYVVISRGNLVKKVIGLNIFQTSVFLLYITQGKVRGGTAPILLAHDAHDALAHDTVYSNPLPGVLILTAIVVGVATTALACALIIRVHEAYGTIEEDEITAADRAEDAGETIAHG